MKKSLKHVKELDGMRGCAAAAVFVFHVFNTTAPNPGAAMQPLSWRLILHVATFGAFGVTMFFVLSGFLITSLLLADRESQYFFRNFYWKRVLRIQPVYVVHLIVAWFLIPGSTGYVLLALVFLVNFSTEFHVPDTGPAWTLAIEEQFYLLWPQVIRRLSLANIYRTCMGLIVFTSLLRAGMIVMQRGNLKDTWYQFDGLAIGALLACEWMTEGEGQTPVVRRFLRVLHSNWCLVVALVYELYALEGNLSHSRAAFVLTTTGYLVYRVIRYILLHPGARTFRWLRSAPLLFLGSISYSMYMYHAFFLYVFDRYLWAGPFSWRLFLWRTLFTVATTLVACIASLYLLERPVQGLRRYVVR
jgi:peptidoglycan/LPS O-acetylase OafA/YrhL